jgi:hypothetical protein
MILAQVAIFLGSSYLGNPARRIGIRSLVASLALVRSFLFGLCIGSFLGTYVLNSLERQEKRIHVHRSHAFLVKVELILPCVWAHPNSVTR